MRAYEAPEYDKKLYLNLVKTKKALSSRRLSEIICEKLVFLLTVASAVIIILVFCFIANEALPIIKMNSYHFITSTGFDRQIIDAYSAPAGQPVWQFGLLGLLVGTLTTTLGALALAVPMGLGTAIVISELAPQRIRYMLQVVVRLLASIPSVIYGLIGLMVVVPFIREF